MALYRLPHHQNAFNMFSFAVVSTALLLLARWLLRTRSNSKGLPYPPGPRALPIIGNSHQLPSSYWWLVYAEWAKKYGDIVHFEVLGKHFIVLNSTDTINELLEQRSVNYSDRPRMPMLVELYECFSVLFPCSNNLW